MLFLSVFCMWETESVKNEKKEGKKGGRREGKRKNIKEERRIQEEG